MGWKQDESEVRFRRERKKAMRRRRVEDAVAKVGLVSPDVLKEIRRVQRNKRKARS